MCKGKEKVLHSISLKTKTRVLCNISHKSNFLRRESMNPYQWFVFCVIYYQVWKSCNISRQTSYPYIHSITPDDLLYSNFTHQLTIEVCCSNVKWERKMKANVKKKNTFFIRSSYLCISRMQILIDLALSFNTLGFTHKTTSHGLKNNWQSFYICTSHLIMTNSFCFMKPRWNDYIKGWHGYRFIYNPNEAIT